LDIAPAKTKLKRPSKGMRKHNRSVKQEARKAGMPGAEVKKNKRLAKALKL
jgi:hypothetical protein